MDHKSIGSDSRSPVLVELFTSEGCSDCPPADALLKTLDQSQPVPDAELIVLSEHVDYWDSDGWRDPYSAHDLTLRQQGYADHFRLDTPYTPQMVIDGSAQILGSDERAALANIEKAAAVSKIPVQVQLSSIHLEGDKGVAMHIDIGSAASAQSASGDVWVALADDSDRSSVKAGENAGHVLSHVAVVRRLTKVGKAAHGMFSGDVTVPAKDANLRKLRVVVFVQAASYGRILAVGTAQLPD
jgi:hypothetical protein